MKKVIVGNHAVSYGVQLARAQVLAAYPITPQSSVVEELSEICADGKLDARFIKVESEHSAMATIIGACSTGVRAFTATSSQGLALMHELLHWASGARLPLVMANVNRALGPGWNIWADQLDSLSQRDTGWMQVYCEDNQEVLDATIQAFRIAELVNLPMMITFDAFFLSHTSEVVDIPDQEEVDRFLPKYDPEFFLNTKDPRSFGALTSPDHYMEMRYKIQSGMDKALKVSKEVFQEFNQIFGRQYDLVEKYKMDDAQVVLVTAGTVTSTSKEVVDELRDKGEKVGLLKIRMFRPFPAEEILEALKGRKKVLVLDRNMSPGLGGIFAQEVKAVVGRYTPVHGFVAGLGGRDITPDAIKQVISKGKELEDQDTQINWVGLHSS